MKRFYFADEKSAKKYENDYQNFIQNNTRDVHQDYSSTFGIDGFQDNVGFCALGDGGHNSCMFYILTFIGLALPYVCILERSVSRYSIDIVKRLTCS